MRITGTGKIYNTILFLFFLLGRKKKAQGNGCKFKKILITVSKGAGLGNIILALPTLKTLREKLPQADITLLCHGNAVPEKLGAGKIVDRIIHVQETSPVLSKIRRILEIRKTCFDLVINPEFYGTSILIYSVIALGNFVFRLGHCGRKVQPWAKKWEFLYNIKVDLSTTAHEADYYSAILIKLGIEDRENEHKPKIILKNDDAFFSTKDSNKIFIDRPYICFAPGSNPNQAWKRWPYTKYAELACHIIDNSPYGVVLLGTGEDFDCAEKIVEMNNNGIVNLCGKTTLNQAISCLRSAKMLVTNDSGLMHLAGAIGKPVIALYGPTDRARTYPLGDNSTIISNNLECSPCYNSHNKGRIGRRCNGRIDCLNSLDVNEVLSTVFDKLNLSRPVV